MLANLFFDIGSSIALAAWLLLVVGVVEISANTTRRTLFIGGRVIPILISVLYAVLAVVAFGTSQEGSYSSLENIGILFQDPINLSSGWLHFLAFDLLVGRWIIDEALGKKVSKLTLTMSLPLTFLYGPVGLLVHLLLRALNTRFLSKNAQLTKAD